MTRFEELLNASPPAAATSNVTTHAIPSVRRMILCLAGVGLGGWTSWGARELEPAGIRVPFEPSIITIELVQKAETHRLSRTVALPVRIAQCTAGGMLMSCHFLDTNDVSPAGERWIKALSPARSEYRNAPRRELPGRAVWCFRSEPSCPGVEETRNPGASSRPVFQHPVDAAGEAGRGGDPGRDAAEAMAGRHIRGL